MDRVNDFAFKIATANGTGSASANGLIMQAIFRMGVPVTGKNVFPSNIQGLPTWYEIRVSKDGYTARPAEVDLVVALNPATYPKDVAAVRRGGWLLYDSSWPLDRSLIRDDIPHPRPEAITVYPKLVIRKSTSPPGHHADVFPDAVETSAVEVSRLEALGQ